jgi:hypothetical protein
VGREGEDLEVIHASILGELLDGFANVEILRI